MAIPVDPNTVSVLSENGPIVVNTGPLPSEYEMGLKVRYRSDVALVSQVNTQNGCCIYYDEHVCENNPERLLVPLPSEEDVKRTETSEKVKKKTQEVLSLMQYGFILEHKDRCIYLRRRCRSTIYYYSSQQTPGQRPINLRRDQNIKIFDYVTFDQDLRKWYTNWRSGKQMKLIRPKICLSFAESWQPYHRGQNRGHDRPQPTAIDTCCVSMYIVPLKARDMILSLEEGRKGSETLTMGLSSGHLFISNEETEGEISKAQEERLSNVHSILAQQDSGQQQQQLPQQQELYHHQQQVYQEMQQPQQLLQEQYQQPQQQCQQQQHHQLCHQPNDSPANNGFEIQLQNGSNEYPMIDVINNGDMIFDGNHGNLMDVDTNQPMIEEMDLLADYPISNPQKLQEIMDYLTKLE